MGYPVTRHRKRTAWVGLIAALSLVLAACGQPAATPAASKPAETKPAETKPAEQKPAETKPAEQKPAASQAPVEDRSKWPKQFMFAAAPKGGAWYPVGAGLVKIIQDATGAQGTIIEAGGNANVIAVADGKADFAIAQVFTAMDGIVGKPPFTKKYTNINGLFTLFDGLFQMAVPKSSDIKTIPDLKGKRISCGVSGQATVNQCEMILKAYGLSFKDMAKVEYISTQDASLMLKDGRVDGVSPGITGYPVSGLIDVGTSKPLRLLPVSDEAIKKIQADNPAFLPATLPANTYAGQDQPVPVLKTATGIIASPDLPADFVYAVVKAIAEHQKDVAAIHPTLKSFKIEDAVDGMRVPLHPGAAKYYKEKGLVK